MAASSTDKVYSSQKLNKEIPLCPEYPLVSVSTDLNNFWGDVSNSTSPSSEQNYEVVDEEEEAIKRKIYEIKRQFHNGRYVYVRNLPKDSTEQDVKNLLKDNLIHSVHIQPEIHSASVILAEPELLESWTITEGYINGTKVTVQQAETENVLCICRLPSSYEEEQLLNLLSGFGEINYCFLMRSEKTGESKGYGFVQFVTKESAKQAKTAIDRRKVLDSTLICDWLESSHVTFSSLHSKCLYIANLPKDYRDMGEFRKIFSVVHTPMYCQIAMKNGALQEWGLVEFKSAENAEETRNKLNNHMIQNECIRVDYYIPGIRAVNIYMKLTKEDVPKKQLALLPEPPTNKVFLQLKNLSKNNPAFAKSLQNIILMQIQNLQDNRFVSSNLHPKPHFGIDGEKVDESVSSSAFTHSNDYPLNSNAQAALVILLAAQLQQQQGSDRSILSNPQVLQVLQTLVSQGDPHQQSNASTTSLTSTLKANFRNGYFKFRNKLQKETPVSNTESYNPKVETVMENNVNPLLGGLLNNAKLSSSESLSELLSNSHNLQQLLGIINSEMASNHTQQNIPVSSIPNPTIPCLLSSSFCDPNVQNPPLGVMPPQQEQFHPERFLQPYPPSHPPFIVGGSLPGSSQAPWNFNPEHVLAQPAAPVFATPYVPRLVSPILIPTSGISDPSFIPALQPGNPYIALKGYNTPIRQKRKNHFNLPSPEASPENGYIGQHSQGIGGHYPDSYSRKKKKY